MYRLFSRESESFALFIKTNVDLSVIFATEKYFVKKQKAQRVEWFHKRKEKKENLKPVPNSKTRVFQIRFPIVPSPLFCTSSLVSLSFVVLPWAGNLSSIRCNGCRANERSAEKSRENQVRFFTTTQQRCNLVREIKENLVFIQIKGQFDVQGAWSHRTAMARRGRERA